MWELQSGPCEYEVAIDVHFFRKNRRRVDLDNLLKLCMDAANGVLWEDDWQVKEITARMSVDPKDPRTVLTVEAL
jgi:Holliday junction resolvase RusA-like endonuclease